MLPGPRSPFNTSTNNSFSNSNVALTGSDKPAPAASDAGLTPKHQTLRPTLVLDQPGQGPKRQLVRRNLRVPVPQLARLQKHDRAWLSGKLHGIEQEDVLETFPPDPADPAFRRAPGQNNVRATGLLQGLSQCDSQTRRLPTGSRQSP